MTWNIVCDSSCDLLPSDFVSDCAGFETVPLMIRAGEMEFLDDEHLSTTLLLSEMSTASSSSTACPPPTRFARAFSHADCTICITISSNLSGTYNAACLGRELALEQNPDRQILVLDSRSTAGAMVLLARKAESLIAGGLDFPTVCGILTEYQTTLRTVFTLECYDNLIRNGRMRPLVGNLLHTLGIHVVAEGTPQGTIQVTGKARGDRKTFRTIVDRMRSSKDCTDARVVLSHCENLEGALQLKEMILSSLPVHSVELLSCRGLTTFYAMRSGLILGF